MGGKDPVDAGFRGCNRRNRFATGQGRRPGYAVLSPMHASARLIASPEARP